MARDTPVVSVTDPPGTGKSHTIANLVAHAMAKGHRVLVTARTAEAISVVREKLPDSLRTLVIASTGTDRDSIESLKSTVAQLFEDIVTMDKAAASRRREELEATILQYDARMREADVQLAAIAHANLNLIAVDRERFTPMEFAPRVAQGRDTHGWFDDRPAKAAPGPIGEAVAELRAALPRLAPDLGLVGAELPGAADLPTAEALLNAHAHEAARKSRPVLDTSAYPPMAVNGPDDLAFAKDLLSRLNALENEVVKLQEDQAVLFEDLHANRGAPDASARVLNALRMLKLDRVQANVRFPKHEPLDALKTAAGRGAAGQNPAPGMFNRSMKRSVADVRVGDAPPASPDDWRLGGGHDPH